MFERQREEAELRRLHHVKQAPVADAVPMGPDLVEFFKQSVQKRQTKLAKIAGFWQELVPPALAEHTCLEGFSRGSLTVLVDSSSHLYDLRQLLLAGLEQQLLFACSTTGLRRITLKPGRWYDAGDTPGQRKPRFEKA